MKTIKTIKISSLKLTKRKYEKIAYTLKCFKDSVNFLIDKCVENPLFKKVSKKGNVYYNYSSYPKIRKNFYFEWKSLFPHLHTHYCHSSARITKDILKSWNSWCFKKRKRLPNPTYKKNSMKLEECLSYLKESYLILVIEPRSKLYIPFKTNKHYNVLKTDNHGEITLRLSKDRTIDIFIPFISKIEEKTIKSIVGIDINERSVDMLIVNDNQVEFESIDCSEVSTTHYTYSLKRKNIAKSIDNGGKYQPNVRKKLLNKYGRKERNKTKDLIHKLSNKVAGIVEINDSVVVMEDLTNIRQSNSRQKNLKIWQKKKSKKMRRRLNRWNFKQFQSNLKYKANSTGHLVEYINPRNTSVKCLKCGKITRCKSQVFTCKHCGFSINRHFQATFNIIEAFLKSQNVASSDPAERRQMKTMAGELCKFKESIVRDASQCGKVIQNYPILST